MRSNPGSRRQILSALRAAPQSFSQAEIPQPYRPVVPRSAEEDTTLVARFVAEAEKLAACVHQVKDEPDALTTLTSLLGSESSIACWAPQAIPLPGLSRALAEAGIQCTGSAAARAPVGLSGAQAGLAATGSLVLSSGPGRYRATSLLPPVHIAILRENLIMPDLESWLASQREDGFVAMRHASNIIMVSGPSRTADIAMELVMGMHGPRELHIVLLP